MVMISQNELKSLIENSAKFEALVEMGVDNWQGYEEVDWDNVDDIIQFTFEEFGV